MKPVTVDFAPEELTNQITTIFYECLVDLKVRDSLQLIVRGRIDWTNALFRLNFHRLTKRFGIHLREILVHRDAGILFHVLNTLCQSVLMDVEGLAKSLIRNFSHGYHIDIPTVKTWESSDIPWVGSILDLWLVVSHYHCVPHSHNINVIGKSVNFLCISFNGHRNVIDLKVNLITITYTHSLQANWTLIWGVWAQ